MAAALAAIPLEARTTSLFKWRKWRNLLGFLQSITPDVSGSKGMFTRVQHALKKAVGPRVQLTTNVHNDLETWHELVFSLANRPTRLRELEPFSPSWIGTTDASGAGMGGVCQDPERQYYVWCSPFSQATQVRLVSSSKPKGGVTVNELEIGVLLMQILLFSPRMDPLAHIHTYANNTAAHGWANMGIVSTSSSVGPNATGTSFSGKATSLLNITVV